MCTHTGRSQLRVVASPPQALTGRPIGLPILVLFCRVGGGSYRCPFEGPLQIVKVGGGRDASFLRELAQIVKVLGDRSEL